MKIALFHDGTYKKFRNNDNINSLIPDIKYLVLDNSTLLKGKTYTIVDASRIRIDDFKHPDLINLSMDISYAAIDTPCCDETTLTSVIQFNSMEKMYSIYPLIRQCFNFNFYKDIYLSIDNMISIDSITIKTKDKDICLDSDDLEDILKKCFRKLNLSTDVDNLLGIENHLILKKGEWYVDKIIPNKFDFIGYNLCGIETIYLLSNKQFSRLSMIDRIDIVIYDKTDEHDKVYNLNYEDLDPYIIDNEFNNTLKCFGLNSILENCVYFPQLLELEKLIYQKNIALQIKLVTKHLNYTLNITEEETREEGLCLFKIINKLLQM